MTPELIAGITGLLAIVVALYTAATSARQSAFSNLEKVVDELRTDLTAEKKTTAKLERWARRLVRQLIEAGIEPTPYDTDERIEMEEKQREELRAKPDPGLESS